MMFQTLVVWMECGRREVDILETFLASKCLGAGSRFQEDSEVGTLPWVEDFGYKFQIWCPIDDPSATSKIPKGQERSNIFFWI